MNTLAKWLKVALFIVLLTACAPSPEVSNGESTEIPDLETEVASTPIPSPEAKPTLTKTKQPASSPVPVATVSPTSAVGEDQSEIPEGVVILLRQEGGFAGVDITWLIYGDGRVEQEDELIGELDSETMQLLMDKIDESGFFDLAQKESENICCDFFTFTLTVTGGERENSITISEADPELPPGLGEVIFLILQTVSESS